MAAKSDKRRYGTHVTTPAGKRIYLSGGSRKELADKVAQARVNLGMGVDISDATTFRQYAETWRKAYKVGKIRENSLATLDTNLYTHVIPFFGDRKLRDIKPLDIQLFLGSISQYSKSTQDKCFQIVRGILRSAAENGLLLRSPVTSNDKTGGAAAEEEEPLTPAQCRALLAATYGTRAYLFCLLALTCGLRRSELLGLMWEDIDLEAGTLTVCHTKTFAGQDNDAPGAGGHQIRRRTPHHHPARHHRGRPDGGAAEEHFPLRPLHEEREEPDPELLPGSLGHRGDPDGGGRAEDRRPEGDLQRRHRHREPGLYLPSPPAPAYLHHQLV